MYISTLNRTARLVPPQSLLKWLCSLGCVATFLGIPSLAGAQPLPGPRIVINIPAARLTLYDGVNPVKVYPVGLGQPRYPTPQGQFKVIRKTRNPGWENPYLKPGKVQVMPGQNNPLGTRWIGFKPGPAGEYGIHGTDTPQSVGQFRSHGCVRMKNQDVLDLFERVKLGTPVQVVYEPLDLRIEKGRLIVRSYPDIYHLKRNGVSSTLARVLQMQPHQTTKGLSPKLFQLAAHPGRQLDLGAMPVHPNPVAQTLPPPPIVLSSFSSHI